jgi:uncharacterized protein YjbI with pentapeptide repeats
MANDDHIAQLKKGVAAWNAWRKENPYPHRPDLNGANLSRANLSGADLRRADLRKTNLSGANLNGASLYTADLLEANLSGAILRGANLIEANLSGANLYKASLNEADLSGANLYKANLSGAFLVSPRLIGADLSDADLSEATIIMAQLGKANFSRANLAKAHLSHSFLPSANLAKANLSGAKLVQNVLVEVNLTEAKQKIRGVIDTITSKAVLILGRFTDDRKAVLDALREELRKREYLPILFDFSVPATRDITETVSLLARMARFIIADLTDPSSIPKELEAIVPSLAVPVQPLIEASSPPYAMFKDYWKYEWVLPVYRYEGLEPLLATLAEKVIAPAEGKVKALAERRRRIEAELTKTQ